MPGNNSVKRKRHGRLKGESRLGLLLESMGAWVVSLSADT